jgi:hypothetical protein
MIILPKKGIKNKFQAERKQSQFYGASFEKYVSNKNPVKKLKTVTIIKAQQKDDLHEVFIKNERNNSANFKNFKSFVTREEEPLVKEKRAHKMSTDHNLISINRDDSSLFKTQIDKKNEGKSNLFQNIYRARSIPKVSNIASKMKSIITENLISELISNKSVFKTDKFKLENIAISKFRNFSLLKAEDYFKEDKLSLKEITEKEGVVKSANKKIIIILIIVLVLLIVAGLLIFLLNSN